MVGKMKKFQSTCSYCGVGCGVDVSIDKFHNISVEGTKDYPSNKGMLCSKGMGLGHVVQDTSDRLTYPTMRWAKNLPHVRVTWDQALDKAAATFKTFIKKYGPDSVGFYVSGQCLTEEYYVVNKLAKAYIGTNNVDTNSRLCMSSAVVGYKLALGEDAVPISYDDIELADTFFITGANPAWCHPILFRRIEKHKQENPDVKIIVADPRKTQTCYFADLHLQLIPGTDVYLNNAIAKCLIDGGYADLDFILKHTDGYGPLKASLSDLSLEDLSANCGVPIQDIHLAAQYIGEAKGYISMWAMGLNQSSIGVNKNLSLINLSIITGKIGKLGNGPFSLTGQPNAMGGREVGGMANLLPAHRDLANPEHRKEVATYWGVDSVPAKPGFTATEMVDAIMDGKLKAIWVICTNPLVSLPNARLVEKALQKANLVIVQDISKNAITAEYADIVLPAAGWLEKEGTMTNSDRRISYLPKAIDAPGEAKSDVSILCEFGRKMGFPNFGYRSEEEIFNEHKGLTKGTNIDISGLSYAKLKELGSAQWPFKEGAEKGQERLFTDFKFYTPNQKAKLFTIENPNQSEPISREFPLVLTTGRIRDQWHTMTRTGKVSKLKKHIDNAFLEMHPEDAKLRGIKNGEITEIFNNRGRVKANVKITNDIRKGVVFLPMHWGKILNSDSVRANNLTSTIVDPKSKEPDFKYAAVEVELFRKRKETIAVIGAGAAAYQFISDYRKYNTKDVIKVFSREKHPFYNRILLPEYLTGHKSWDGIQKHDKADLLKWNIQLYTKCEILKIEAKSKYVIDNQGREHAYDKLIICTGSRPNVPKGVKIDFKSTYTIRDRGDADRLKESLKDRNNVTVVGGGLLGLEIASSLIEYGIKVNVIHRNSRLMDKQLDKISSELLGESISEKGIDLYLNDEIEKYAEKDSKTYRIDLKSGRKLDTQAIVYAIGTKPNVELAENVGIVLKRGVVVDAHLETSEKNVFAMGEIAEFEGKMYGITAAAEQQASIIARYLSGDDSVIYEGSVGMNILKFPGIELCSIGFVNTPEDEAYEEILFIDKRSRYYKKCIIYRDRLIGTILMGDKTEFSEFKSLIESRLELSSKRLTLLRNGQKATPVKGTVICSCNNVGEGNLTDELAKGLTDMASLCKLTGAGMGCGSCKPEIQAIFEESTKNKQVHV